METKFVLICLKILLLLYSFIFWITGVTLLVIGVWGKLTLGIYLSLIARNSIDVPTVLIGTGTMIVSFGLFGCFAACRGILWMLKLYSLLLSLVFLAELVASISAPLFHREIKDSFLKIYTNAVQNYNGKDEKSQAVDQVQHSLICCGVKNYTDWKTSPYFLDHGIPHSCCKDQSDCDPQDLHNLTIAATKVNQRGCYNLMMSFLERNMGVVIGVLFAATFYQLIGIRLSCCLSRYIIAHQYEMM
ncbi:tetraspanin-7-like [Peromyscus californicus insignis]|uniref:tetraspanin-7-like n=1 Tax=Peromyscus californicus insignis TaxID=564181 RepID=UPI0022A723AC|nr:tetraspanin-7-like [Peromyscus californicus insignis]